METNDEKKARVTFDEQPELLDKLKQKSLELDEQEKSHKVQNTEQLLVNAGAQPEKDPTFKCDCHYPCDNYPHCGGHKITFDEQAEKETANAILNKFCTRFQADSPIEEGRPLVVTVTEALKAINFALCQQPKAAGQEQEDDEYLERVLFLSLAQRDCTTDEGLDKAVEETFWNLKDKFTITRKP